MIELNFYGGEKVTREIRFAYNTLTEYFADLMLSAMKTSLIVAKDDNFNESAFNGQSWKPFAKATIEGKKEQGKWPAKLLIDTGTLKNRWQTMGVRQNTVLFSTNTPYAAFQNFGGKVELGPHKVSPSHVKEHDRIWKGQKVHVRAHDRSGYMCFESAGTRVIPARPFLPSARENLEDYCSELEALLQKNSLPCEIKLTSFSE